MPQIDPRTGSRESNFASFGGACEFGFVDGWAVIGRSSLVEGWRSDDDGREAPWSAPDRMVEALCADEDMAGFSGS